MSLKKNLPIIALAFFSVFFGMYYTKNIMPVDPWISNPFHHFNRYFFNFIIITAFSYTACLIFTYFFQKIRNTKKEIPFIAGYIAILSIAIIYMHIRYFGFTIINLTIISFIYPVVFYLMQKQFNKRYGTISLTALFTLLLCLCRFVSDEKMFFLTAAVFIIAEIVSVCTYKFENKSLWVAHTVILFIITLTMLYISVGNNPSLIKRTQAFLNPSMLPEYSALIDYIKNCSLFAYNPFNSFANDIGSVYACPYAHIISCFGLLPAIAIAAVSEITVILMIKNSLTFKPSLAKVVGITLALIPAIYLIIGILSSLLLIPMIEIGAPFTAQGLPFTLLPTFMYIFIAASLNTAETEDKVKIED